MSLAHLTRLHIYSSFKELASKDPFYKISVKNITEYADINKSTFYYHFEDKYDLIRAIFRADLGALLIENFKEEDLVYSDDPHDKYAEHPYYIDTRNADADLDCGPNYVHVSNYLIENSQNYSNIFRSDKPDGLKFYFHNLYLGEMRKDIVYALDNRTLPKEDIDFLAQYFTSACFDFYFYTVPRHSEFESADYEGAYNNITHELMKYCLDARIALVT